jgi:hypothetical protein
MTAAKAVRRETPRRRSSSRRRGLVALWHTLARAAEFLPTPPITRNQVELMQTDTVASPQLPGLKELGITPQPLEETVRQVVRHR